MHGTSSFEQSSKRFVFDTISGSSHRFSASPSTVTFALNASGEAEPRREQNSEC